ncbi:mucin-5AC-like [Branchiostoma floridae]|uniref:Mucin-5AC-like n=1 Tax=Branchiostoma floridae TaxID=7739 RepID=A0A9J7MQQ5_BRAFL|nr:mucin-5AC-like [Branchiostoma floridae]
MPTKRQLEAKRLEPFWFYVWFGLEGSMLERKHMISPDDLSFNNLEQLRNTTVQVLWEKKVCSGQLINWTPPGERDRSCLSEFVIEYEREKTKNESINRDTNADAPIERPPLASIENTQLSKGPAQEGPGKKQKTMAPKGANSKKGKKSTADKAAAKSAKNAKKAKTTTAKSAGDDLQKAQTANNRDKAAEMAKLSMEDLSERPDSPPLFEDDPENWPREDNEPAPTDTSSAIHTPIIHPASTSSATHTPIIHPASTSSAIRTPITHPASTSSAIRTPIIHPASTSSAIRTPIIHPASTSSAIRTPIIHPASTSSAIRTPITHPASTSSAIRTPMIHPASTSSTIRTPIIHPAPTSNPFRIRASSPTPNPFHSPIMASSLTSLNISPPLMSRLTTSPTLHSQGQDQINWIFPVNGTSAGQVPQPLGGPQHGVAIYPHLLTKARNSGKTPEQFFKILMGLYFTEEELFRGNLTGGGDRNHQALNPAILGAILAETRLQYEGKQVGIYKVVNEKCCRVRATVKRRLNKHRALPDDNQDQGIGTVVYEALTELS